jgi:hypothetical protein
MKKVLVGGYPRVTLCSEFWPVHDGAGQETDVDEIEWGTEGPFFFYVVDFKLNVRRDPDTGQFSVLVFRRGLNGKFTSLVV